MIILEMSVKKKILQKRHILVQLLFWSTTLDSSQNAGCWEQTANIPYISKNIILDNVMDLAVKKHPSLMTIIKHLQVYIYIFIRKSVQLIKVLTPTQFRHINTCLVLQCHMLPSCFRITKCVCQSFNNVIAYVLIFLILLKVHNVTLALYAEWQMMAMQYVSTIQYIFHSTSSIKTMLYLVCHFWSNTLTITRTYLLHYPWTSQNIHVNTTKSYSVETFLIPLWKNICIIPVSYHQILQINIQVPTLRCRKVYKLWQVVQG